MNHATRTIGDATSVIGRWGSESTNLRPEKLMDVLVFNSTASLLYMHVFDIPNSVIAFGTKYSGSGASTPTTVASTSYTYVFGTNDTSITNGSTTYYKSSSATGSVVLGTDNLTVTFTADSVPHGFTNGDTIAITGILPATPFNGTYTITVIDTMSFSYKLQAVATSKITSSSSVTATKTLQTATFITSSTTVTLAGTASATITGLLYKTLLPQIQIVPASTAVPKFSFPVQPGLGGTLGRSVDMVGIYCAWSTTQATFTATSASGSIAIILKG
jgi:hypothetical protein